MYHYVTIKDGKKRLVWTNLLVFVAVCFALVIAAAEAFWYFLTGGLSPLVGGFGLVAATLMVIRIVGASLADPVIGDETGRDDADGKYVAVKAYR